MMVTIHYKCLKPSYQTSYMLIPNDGEDPF